MKHQGSEGLRFIWVIEHEGFRVEEALAYLLRHRMGVLGDRLADVRGGDDRRAVLRELEDASSLLARIEEGCR